MLSTKTPMIEIAAGNVDDKRAEEICRNLTVLYGTQTGEQALDREFGIDSGTIDCPQENARALLTAEYVRKTQRYEPRARVVRVEWTSENSPEGVTNPKVVIELV